MEETKKQVYDYMDIILGIVIEQNIGPTHAARLLYVYTSLIRCGIKIIKPQTTLASKFKLKKNIINSHCRRCENYEFFHNYKYYRSFRNNYNEYLAVESLKMIELLYPESQIIQKFKDQHPISKVFKKTNRKFRRFLRDKHLLREINSELKSFYLYLDEDGWKNGDKQIKLENDYLINPHQPIDVNQMKNPSTWTPLVQPGTNNKPQKQLGPYWNDVKGVLSNKETQKIEDDLAEKFKNIDTVSENKEVLEISLKLTDKEKISAEFFQAIPGTIAPSGYWTQWCACALRANPKPNSVQSDIFYKLCCATFQASITCWKIKYTHLHERPIQCIRLNYADEKFDYYFGNNVSGDMWTPYQEERMISPPFPDYISGHSTFSAAAAHVLTESLGPNIGDEIKISTEQLLMCAPIFKDQPHEMFKLNEFYVNKNTSLIQQGVPKERIVFKHATWEDLAWEAGMSRIYGGIHIQSSNIEGLKCGKRIGALILKRLKKKNKRIKI